MEASLSRKPLTPAELSATKITLCVTGAAGYIGSTVVCRLLAAGHTVHATYRKQDDETTVAALNDLPGAAERLRWFEADLSTEGSFDAAVADCQAVIHMACPVTLRAVPTQLAFSRMVHPAVRGVANVLRSVSRAQSVRRVVMTSSISAAMWGPRHDDPTHILTEEDWNVSFSTQVPYSMAKTVSEWEAWAITGQQSRWSLVTICPAVVIGPPLATSRASESVDSIRKLMDGSGYPFAMPLDMPVVDIADVAAAHCLAAVLPEAQGRYVLCERGAQLPDLAATLSRLFPQYWVPYLSCPYWLAAALCWLTGIVSQGALRETYGRKTLVSSEKALGELKGLAPLIPMERSLKEMVEAAITSGLLPDKRGAKAAKQQ